MKRFIFLDVESVLGLYKDSITDFGGSPGLRDKTLLESALHQPEASASGENAHQDIYEMAAAYCFH